MKKSVLCLALSLALVLAFAPVRAAENMPEADSSKANPVDQLTGAMWQKTSGSISFALTKLSTRTTH